MGSLRAPKPSWLWMLALIGSFQVGLSSRTSGLRRLQRCEEPARFTVNNVEPLALTRGYVTLVALLTSTCSFCLQQARSLEILHQELQQNGEQVRMFVVNGGDEYASEQINNLIEIVSFPVYQDNNEGQIWRQVFRGSKDDILIFNRCGMLTYHLKFPTSYLGYNYVRQGLRMTFERPQMCSSCQIGSSNPGDVMVGDDPASHSFDNVRNHRNNRHGHYQGNHADRNINRSRCPQDDPLCREMRRFRRRWNRRHTMHGLSRDEDHTAELIGRVMGTRKDDLPDMLPMWECNTVNITEIRLTPTHRCFCPREDVSENCNCSRSIPGNHGGVIGYRCGCHNPSSEVTNLCNCRSCFGHLVCLNDIRKYTCHMTCSCPSEQNTTDSRSTQISWPWPQGGLPSWQTEGQLNNWQGLTGSWQWQSAASEASAAGWQWQHAQGDTSTARWQWQPAQGDTSTARWQWQSTLGEFSDGRWNWQPVQGDISTARWQWQSTLGEFPDGIWNWQPVQGNISTARWQWQSAQGDTSTARWQWQSTLGYFPGFNWNWQPVHGNNIARWQWQESVSAIQWQPSTESRWQSALSTSESNCYWQDVNSISGTDWQWQGVTPGNSWQWATSGVGWQWQNAVSGWEWQGTKLGNSWQWLDDALNSWSWQWNNLRSWL